jgi:transposase
VDVGLNHLAVFSDAQAPVEGPKALRLLLQRLRRLSRAHSRKVKGSANRKKSAQRLARLHWHIANIRNNALHQLTHRLTRDYGWVAIEDLNVKGMLPLSVRRWTCPVCQAEHDRDQNAARNILAESMRNVTSGVGGGACGA